jgi:hypothetical protein
MKTQRMLEANEYAVVVRRVGFKRNFLEAPPHKTVLAVPKFPLEPVLATGPI